MFQIKYHVVLLAFLLFISCGQHTLSPREYAGWVTDRQNGLQVSQESGDYRFSLQYQPPDYIMLSRLKKENLTQAEADSIRKETAGIQYYVLSIENKKGATNTIGAGEPDAYLVDGMQHDLQLVDGADTLPCLLYHYEPAYDINPADKIVLGFAANNSGKAPCAKTLIYKNRLSGTGNIVLTIGKEAIEQIPNLKLND